MPTTSQLCLLGRCTIAEVPAQRDLITAALSTGNAALTLDLSGVEQADVTLVQLLIAAQIEAASRSRAFAVSAWSSAAEDAFVRAGLPVAEFAPPSAIGA